MIMLNDSLSVLDMSSENPKRALFEGFAEVAKALAHGQRLEILELLAQGRATPRSLAGCP